MIFLYLTLTFSTALNGFLIWYCYNLLRDRISLVQLFKEFNPLIKKYEEHLVSLTKMEMYFGEPVLMSLIDHTKELNQTLDNLMQSIEVEETENDDTEEK